MNEIEKQREDITKMLVDKKIRSIVIVVNGAEVHFSYNCMGPGEALDHLATMAKCLREKSAGEQ